MNIVGEEDEQQCNNMNRKIQKNQNHKSTTPPCHLCGAETTMVPPPLHLAVVGRLQIWVATKLPLFVPPQLPLGSTKLDHCGRRRRKHRGEEKSAERQRGRRRDVEAKKDARGRCYGGRWLRKFWKMKKKYGFTEK